MCGSLCDEVDVKGPTNVCVCVCVSHIPAVEKLLGNPSKKDLELVGSQAGQWGTEGEAKGDER